MEQQDGPVLRRARRDDVAAIAALINQDAISVARNGPPPSVEEYEGWFDLIDACPANELLVLELAGRVAGTAQLTFIPGLGRRTRLRCLVEAVRVDEGLRGQGRGSWMMREILERARARGCTLVQLTTDKRRTDAHRFYQRLGFAATHEGMKLYL